MAHDVNELEIAQAGPWGPRPIGNKLRTYKAGLPPADGDYIVLL